MSVDLSIGYRFMLRNKRHCLQVLGFEPSSTNCKQSKSIQVFESLHKHIVPMQYNVKEKPISLNITCVYIVHCGQAFKQ